LSPTPQAITPLARTRRTQPRYPGAYCHAHKFRRREAGSRSKLGIEPILCQPTAAAREQAATDVQALTGATLIHPFNDPQVIAGQGTAALEILEQLADFDTLIVPVGGGGLLAGTLITIRNLAPGIRVIGAEPEWADDARRSLQSGRIEPALRTDSIADGLRTPLGSLTFPIIHALVDDILCAAKNLSAAASQNWPPAVAFSQSRPELCRWRCSSNTPPFFGTQSGRTDFRRKSRRPLTADARMEPQLIAHQNAGPFSGCQGRDQT
jgi:hypothetical protein